MGADKVLIGKITRPVGIKGLVRVFCYTEYPEDVAGFNAIYDKDNNSIDLSITSVKKDFLLASISGVKDRNEAEKFRNTELYVLRSEFPEPEDDEFYHVDLIGLNTYHQTGELHGKVIDVKNYGSCDMLEVLPTGDKMTSFIPFQKPYVQKVDIGKGIIIIEEQIPYEEDY